ncbi:hypothetical protein HJFPF1_12952 [Paramyrothecium foliicola]|nr:hypothetical protein HJFPF1_12952 [Paramyrothecium foliicola]
MNELYHKRLPNQQSLDPIPNEELARRFHNDIIEDPALDQATVDEVGRRFDVWVAEHHHHLAKTTLGQILQLPEDPRASGVAEQQLWIKVVSDWQRSQDEGGRYWLRVGVAYQIFTLYFDLTDGNIVEFAHQDGDDVPTLVRPNRR